MTTKPPTTFADASTTATKPTIQVNAPLCGEPEHEHRADDHDAVDRVRARHQRRVQHRRHLRDHLEAEEDREHEDRHLEDEQGRCDSCGHLLLRHARAGGDLVRPSRARARPRREVQRAAPARCASRASTRGTASTTGRFVRPTSVTPSRSTTSPGSVSSQLPPVSAARSTITEPGRIARTADAGNDLRRRAARDRRRRDHDVELGDARLERLPAAPASPRASARGRSRPRPPRR